MRIKNRISAITAISLVVGVVIQLTTAAGNVTATSQTFNNFDPSVTQEIPLSFSGAMGTTYSFYSPGNSSLGASISISSNARMTVSVSSFIAGSFAGSPAVIKFGIPWSYFDGSQWSGTLIATANVPTADADCILKLPDGYACILPGTGGSAPTKAYFRRLMHIYVGKKVYAYGGKILAEIINENGVTEQISTVVENMIIDNPGAFKTYSWKTLSLNPKYSPQWLAANALAQEWMYKHLSKNDPSIQTLNYFSGRISGCTSQLPMKAFTVPTTGEYHITSYVKAYQGLPQMLSPYALQPVFRIYDTNKTSVLLSQPVSNGRSDGYATFMLENSFRNLGFVTLSANKTYYMEQSYSYGAFGSDPTCKDQYLPDSMIEFGIQVLRQTAKMTNAVATPMGYSTLASLLSVSRLSIDKQAGELWEFAGSGVSSVSANPWDDPGFDRLPNSTKLYYKENWIYHEAFNSQSRYASDTLAQTSSSPSNRCQSADACYFSQMPLLMQDGNTCFTIASAMALAGALSEVDKTANPLIAGSWVDVNWKSVYNTSTKQNLTTLLSGPDGFANTNSPAMRAYGTLTGQLPGISKTVDPNGQTADGNADSGQAVALSGRRIDFRAGAGFRGITNGVYDFDYFKSRLQPTNKYAMQMDIDFITVRAQTAGNGFANITFYLDPNFRGNASENPGHALTVNGYNRTSLLMYNPWQEYLYMNVNTVDAGGSIQWVDGPSGTTIPNKILSLPNAAARRSFLSPSAWASTEFHPESYYWFIRIVSGLKPENSTASGQASLPVINSAPPTSITTWVDLLGQDWSQYPAVNQTVTLNVGVSGNYMPTFQWYKNGVVISGANQSYFDIPYRSQVNNDSYYVKVSNSAGFVQTTPSVLTVNQATTLKTPPKIIKQTNINGNLPRNADPINTWPADLKVNSQIMMSVDVTYQPGLTFQWYRNSVPISGATASTYTFAPLASDNDASYQVKVTNAYGNALSTPLVMKVTDLTQYMPRFLVQPQSSVVVAVGGVANVAAGTSVNPGNATTTMQWKRNGVSIPGATSINYSFNATAADEGASYTLVLADTYGHTVVSSPSVIRITTAPAGLSYSPSTVTLALGAPMSPITPTLASGKYAYFMPNPSLPAGLVFDLGTGAISGTPTAISGPTTYTVTATNALGSTSTTINITVANSVANAPTNLNYTVPASFGQGSAITPITPTVTGSVTSYSVSPALPTGLSLNTTTGVISGTPTVLSAATNYTVTASNASGSTTKIISISVVSAIVAPTNLNYTVPASFTQGVAISPITPTVTGSVTSYSVSPALPTGLSLNTSTGVISGTPTVLSAATNYTVTASNASGSTPKVISISVVSAIVAPTNLNYTVPASFTQGVAISPITPTVTGSVTSYSVAPALPTGLSLNTTTGVISGTPTVLSAATNYTITAINSSGSTTKIISISVSAALAAPANLNYTVPTSFSQWTAITPITPTVTGSVTSYSVTPALPTGLSLNTTTGVISGTPTVLSAATNYTITASNASGSTPKVISISVVSAIVAPTNLNYTVPATFIRAIAITPITPTVTGSVTSYSVTPALPTGLSLNTTTGVISGTPTVLTAAANYTITANNSSGSTTKIISISVSATLTPPTNLSYTVPSSFTQGVAISPITPTVTGSVTSYSVAPAFPAVHPPFPTGMSFNTATGVISGTPTVPNSNYIYNITATNASGSTTATIFFSVIAAVAAPTNLSYIVPVSFNQNVAITPITPTVTGAVTYYSVSPALPTGLTLNTTTGVISGTPTVLSAATNYTVTASNANGGTTTTIRISVTGSVTAPTNLSYTGPTSFTQGVAITPITPTVTGSVTSYSVSPALPAGLILNTSTGVISGTPTVISSVYYTIYASNAGGSTWTILMISVKSGAPTNLSYTVPTAFNQNVAITPITPTVTGSVTYYSVSPALPAGLNLNTTTGVISGTPTVLSAATNYTVTASNANGGTTTAIRISITSNVTATATAPTNLNYIVPTTFTQGVTITPITPTVTGSVTSYLASPSLPAGLSLNTITGVISGAPFRTSASYHTIYAINANGWTNKVISIQVIPP